MSSVQDSIYNWLTIKVVAEARPDDQAAMETYELFADMLRDEHGITDVVVEKREDMYFVTYTKDSETKSTRFPLELIDCFLDQMIREPEKFPNY